MHLRLRFASPSRRRAFGIGRVPKRRGFEFLGNPLSLRSLAEGGRAARSIRVAGTSFAWDPAGGVCLCGPVALLNTVAPAGRTRPGSARLPIEREKEVIRMTWETPEFTEIRMDAEINSYQDHFSDET